MEPASAKEKRPVVGNVVFNRIEAFLRLKWSTAVLAVFLLLLMFVTYTITHTYSFFSEYSFIFTQTLQLYLIDFSVGFVSRALVGQIIAFFTDTVSVTLILTIARCVVLATLVLQAVLAAAAFKHAFLKKLPVACLMCVVFAVSPLTVMPNIVYLGVLDPFNLLLVCLYLYIADKKKAFVFTPLLCALGIILHYQFSLAYLTAVLSIELYYLCRCKEERKLRITSFVFTVLISAGLTVYLMLFSRYGAKMDAPELYSYMLGKLKDAGTMQPFEEYFTYYIFAEHRGVTHYGALDFIGYVVTRSVRSLNVRSLVSYLSTLVPFYGILMYYWVRLFRRAKGIVRLPYLVFMLQPLVFVVSVFASTDLSRWAGASLFSCFALFYTVLQNEDFFDEAAHKPVKWWVFAVLVTVFAAGYVIATVNIKAGSV